MTPGIKEAIKTWKVFEATETSSKGNGIAFNDLVRVATAKGVEDKIAKIAEIAQHTTEFQLDKQLDSMLSVYVLCKDLEKLKNCKGDEGRKRLSILRSALPALELPEQIPNENLENWLQFLRGNWLEFLVAHCISNAIATDEAKDTTIGVRSKNLDNGREFEVDVVHMFRGHGYVLSCTTDPSFAKHKLFEISARSKHLFGRYARAALVVPAASAVIENLKKDLNKDWIGTQQQPSVFGKEDIAEWMNGNFQSLQEWLTAT
ncbi:MAG: hypothetical protein K2X81_20680 [Candidatus Obscuribacterales bacterium]|nr:hypothetical protein [Candidatus Obscuribacterales bacterium]